MKHLGWLISKYLISAIFPYFAFSWLLLTVILFVQQASRYSDIFFNVNIPSNLIWQLTVALVPNVIAFTCPMAMLVGTIIGLTKMQGDSELAAIRAAGVGNVQIAVPIVILGIAMSGFAFLVNLKGVPFAASLVRSVALQTAIKKLESPIEPGVFNTEVAGYTIYVKGGDFETSSWKNIFIYSEDAVNNTLRLITSRKGRIDTTGQSSELVLENATVSTLPMVPGGGKYVSESIGEVRFAIKTKRNELIDKLSITELRPEELGLQQLSEYAAAKDGSDRTEAQILWQRRILLSITPLLFCILGTVIVLRFNRGGRGFGIALALGVLTGFYLLTFLGEQMARVGSISVLASSLIPLAGSVVFVFWIGLSRKFEFFGAINNFIRRIFARQKRQTSERLQARNIFVDLTTGLRDFDIIRNLVKNFVLTLSFLSLIFIIFTAFDRWKFAGAIQGGVWMLAEYLFYLLPFVYLQIAPSAAMIGILATYVIKSRQNEIVTWTSAGQSVYRLLMPCFLLTILLGGVNWLIQEQILPVANQRQDAIRTLINNRGVPVAQKGKYWVANDKRIYSFEIAAASDNDIRKAGQTFASDNEIKAFALADQDGVSASDNETPFSTVIAAYKTGRNIFESGEARYTDFGQVSGRRGSVRTLRIGDQVLFTRPQGNRSFPFAVLSRRFPTDMTPVNFGFPGFGFAAPSFGLFGDVQSASDNENRNASCTSCVKNLTIYEFADNGERLQAVYRASGAEWKSGVIRFAGKVERNDLAGGKIDTVIGTGGELQEVVNPFGELQNQPSHLNTAELKRRVATADSELERRTLAVSLEKKYTTLFLPFVMAVFTAPFSLSLSRKGKAATVGYAVSLWLLFTGMSTVFTQFGLNGFISPQLAVWSPPVFFSLLGIVLLSKVRT